MARGAGLWAMFRAALTWRLYDRALLLAVVYPILLPVLWWLVTGQAAQLGPVVFLEATGFWDVWPERVAILVTFMVVGVWTTMLSGAGPPRNRLGDTASLSDFIFLFALSGASFAVFASAGPLAVASALVSFVALTGAVTGAFIFAVTGAVAVATVIAGASLNAVAAAFLFTGACTIAVATVVLDQRGQPRLSRLLITLGALTLWVDAVKLVHWEVAAINVRTIFLFFSFLPLINAVFDVISYAVTLAFIRRGRESRLPVLYGLADLGIALILFLAVSVSMVAVIAGLNALAGTDILDLGALLRDVRDQPGSYWWLYGIAFSTILPTAAHGGLALLGVQGLWPKLLRRVVAGWIGNASASQIDATRGAFALGLLWAVPVWVIVAFGWAGWHWGGAFATSLAGQYLTVLEQVALALGAR